MKALLAAIGFTLAAQAGACGVCLEDKVASCYDHAVVTKALDRGETVAFFAIQGDIVRSPEAARNVVRAIESARGVRRGTARVSLESAALSFAFDPARTNVARTRDEIAGKLAAQRLDLAFLKLLDGHPSLLPLAGAK